jgi:hypothetical protein
MYTHIYLCVHIKYKHLLQGGTGKSSPSVLLVAFHVLSQVASSYKKTRNKHQLAPRPGDRSFVQAVVMRALGLESP